MVPVDLSVSGRDASIPQVAIAADGTTTVVWRRFNGANYVVQASTRPPGGTFSAPVDVSVAGQDADLPQVAVGVDGSTTATWDRFDGTSQIVQASTRPPGGTFSAPVNLSASATGEDAYDPELALSADGTTTVAWRREIGANSIVRVSTRPPGGTFSAPVSLSVAGQSYRPQVAVAADGTATVTWSGPSNIVQASTRPPGGTFSAPFDLSVAGQDANYPQVAVAADGTTTVVWDRFDGANTIVQASTRPPGSTFAAPVDLSATGQNAKNPQVAVGVDGSTTVVWDRNNSANTIVQASTRPPGGTFAAPVDLSATGQDAVDPQVAVAADGTANVVWDRSNGASNIVQASTRPPGGTFANPVDLSATGQSAGRSQLAFAADGSTTAVWYRNNGTNTIVQAAVTANPPALRAAPQISGSALLGATLGCDGGSWTGAAQVTTGWLRAASQIASGPSYTTTPADQANALSCRARASNQYGSVEALSTPLSIPGPVTPPTPPSAPAPPSARSLPKITGKARLGRTLRCRPATFTAATKRTTSWLRAAKPIKGARRTTYKITKKDLGKIIACRTTATGPGGTSTTISLAVLPRR